MMTFKFLLLYKNKYVSIQVFYLCVSFLDLRMKAIAVPKLYIKGVELKMFSPC